MKSLMRRGARAVARHVMQQDGWHDLLMLQGAEAALQLRNLTQLSCLGDAEFKVFSQWGEGGIIEWLVSRLPGIPQSFVEFGVEDYTEANTRFLLQHRNWRGLIIDGSEQNIKKVQERANAWRHDLTAVNAFVTTDNINRLIADAGFSGEIGLLSIDIDGNDCWVWEAITAVQPWIVIVEYNAVLGDLKPISIPYDAGFQRLHAHHSALYYGASLAAFQHLAAKRGYVLAGSNRAGNNLFYLRNDAVAVVGPHILDRRARPSLYAEARDRTGNLSLVRGEARRGVINELPVTDVVSGQLASLSNMGDLYSPYWTAIQAGTAPPQAQP